MKIKYISIGAFSSSGLNFEPNDIKDVEQKVAESLLKSFPNWFEKVEESKEAQEVVEKPKRTRKKKVTETSDKE